MFGRLDIFKCRGDVLFVGRTVGWQTMLIYQESLRRDSDIVVGSHLESVCNSIETDQETIEYIEVSKFIR